jgi:hypothetical protein
MSNNAFKDFVAQLEEYQIETDEGALSLIEKETIGKIWNKSLDFLESRNLVSGAGLESLNSFDRPISNLSQNTTLSHVGVEAIVDFCRDCDIANDQLFAAACNVGHLLSHNGSMSEHFNSERAGIESLDNVNFQDLGSVFGSYSAATLKQDASAALEAFGQDVDKLTTDIRINIAITIMKFHKNILDRIMFRKPCDSNVIQFSVPYHEVYDLEKAAAKDTRVRNLGDHRVNFIDLYKEPGTANTEAKKIIPLKANDTGATAKLVADEQILFGKEVNLFDMALDATKFGHSHIDYTDLVSEGVLFDTAFLTITEDNEGTIREEIFAIPMKIRSGARFQMRNNSRDSADRDCRISERVNFNKDTTKADGTASSVLAAFAGDAYLQLSLNITGGINLKTADTMVQGQVSGVVVTETGETPVAAVTDQFSKLSFELSHYTLDARYSEENMRKTTAAVRMNKRPMAYEIPVGRNYVVDYSLAQTKPTEVLGTVAQLISIGNDDRGLKLITATMDQVYDRLEAESGGSMFADHRDRVAFDFVAGNKVLPSIFKGEIDLANVESVRSSDILSDVRCLVEKFLLEITAKMHNDSMYTSALDNGEKPHYKVVTSSPILATCFSIPHVHNHLNLKVGVDGETVEYARILPNGTRLDIITTTFNSMIDKIIMIPYRKNNPQSELNFGVNCDRGQFVANYTPVVNQGVSRRVAVNSREIPYTTNPLGAIIQVKNVSQYFNDFGTLDI